MTFKHDNNFGTEGVPNNNIQKRKQESVNGELINVKSFLREVPWYGKDREIMSEPAEKATRPMFENFVDQVQTTAMIGESRQLVTNEPVELGK